VTRNYGDGYMFSCFHVFLNYARVPVVPVVGDHEYAALGITVTELR